MKRRQAPVIAAMLALAAGLVVGEREHAGSAHAAAAPQRPNVLVLETDDQTLAEMEVLPNVRRLIGDQGVTFDNNFDSFSLCCPSRATFLTGQYSHNNGVRGNAPPQGGYQALDKSNTLAVWLQRGGYYTVHLGKFLNGYGQSNPTEIPPGWSEWHGAVDPTTYRYYNYTLNEASYSDALSLGFDLETGGHVFQVFLTNSSSINETSVIPYTESKWSKGQIRLGFNISRVFGAHKSAKP